MRLLGLQQQTVPVMASNATSQKMSTDHEAGCSDEDDDDIDDEVASTTSRKSQAEETRRCCCLSVSRCSLFRSYLIVCPARKQLPLYQ